MGTSAGDLGSQRLQAILSGLRAQGVRGLPVAVELASGSYTIDRFLFDSSIQASSVRIVAPSLGSVVLRATVPTDRLFEFALGAPPVELHGLELQSPLLVSGGTLTLLGCQIRPGSSRGAGRTDLPPAIRYGGALLLAGGSLVAEQSNFTDNVARFGGGLHASAGDASFAGCLFARNAASEHGGGISLSGDARVVLSNGSLLVANSLLGNGFVNSVWVHPAETPPASASLSYTLPAPLGRWVDGSRGSSTGWPLRGSKTELNHDYPNPCAAGLYGDVQSVQAQSGPWCSGICPAGRCCPQNTTAPQACVRGHYCPEGCSIPAPCPPGTVGGEMDLYSREQCTPVPAGAWSAAGAAQGVNCSRGYFNPLPGATNQSACISCPSFSTTTREGATGESDCEW